MASRCLPHQWRYHCDTCRVVTNNPCVHNSTTTSRMLSFSRKMDFIRWISRCLPHQWRYHCDTCRVGTNNPCVHHSTTTAPPLQPYSFTINISHSLVPSIYFSYLIKFACIACVILNNSHLISRLRKRFHHGLLHHLSFSTVSRPMHTKSDRKHRSTDETQA